MFLTGAGDLPQFVQAKLMQDLGMLASQDQCKLMALGHLYLTSLNDEISNNVDLKQVSRLAKEPHIEKSIKSLKEKRNLKIEGHILGAKSHIVTPFEVELGPLTIGLVTCAKTYSIGLVHYL